ncbi:MAG: DNA topoisomerase IB [Solirubrobacterales bacterium]
MPRLRRVDCASPGLTRKSSGRGFTYVDAEGSRASAEDVERIRELAIPPAWQDVWICSDAHGHLQATGVDAVGRKQYIYHPEWRTRRDRQKFDGMLEFAAALPALRGEVLKDLRSRGMTRRRVLGCAIRLLDLGFFRVGSEGYAEQNETYGLATIKRSHVTIESGEIVFDYTAKSGKRRIQVIADDRVRQIVKELKARRGGTDELLAYKQGGRWVDVRSTDINAHLKELTGSDFSAKDFRTWNGTVLAAVSLAGKTDQARTKTGRKRAMSEATKEVAFFLGNTPAVARSSYIDPRVFDRFDSGWTIAARIEELGGPDAFIDPEGRVALEDAVRDLINDERASSRALAKVKAS